MEPNQESAELRASLLQTSATALKMRQRAEQEVRSANAQLEQRTAELAHALAIVRATLAATTDAILVTDDRSQVVEHNQHYVELWRTPPEILEGRSAERLWEMASLQFAVPEIYLARIKEIIGSSGESIDVLELKGGRIVEQFSNALEIDGVQIGRVWGFRDVTDRNIAEIGLRRLAAIVLRPPMTPSSARI